jgi:hypothetical protein
MSEPLDPAIGEAVARGKSVALRKIAEAKLVGQFDQLYENGGVQPCMHIITLLLERLEEKMRGDVARAAVVGQKGWLG